MANKDNTSLLTVIILAYNEEKHIRRAIDSVSLIADQVIVVDSFSKDGTKRIAEECGAIVIEHKFINYAKQFQWAIDNAPITGQWVMRLDADEIVERDLSLELSNNLPTLGNEVVGINLNRKHIFMNKWVRHGGRYPLKLLRIWRHGFGRIEDRWMDEHIIIWGGSTITLRGGFSDWNLNDIGFFIEKHNKYATREAIDIINQKLELFPRDESVNSKSTSFQASIKRRVKERIYNRLPFTFSALLYFLWRYVFQLGFLDGRAGLVYHFLQGYWYRFLVGAKVMEFERATAHLSEKHLVIDELSQLTGHNLRQHSEIREDLQKNDYDILSKKKRINVG